MFTSQIKPIETEYRGYRFRSRLEARWAVFFETLGLEWEYEPEGFVCDKFDNENPTQYLPDFYLPLSETWVEVKGSNEAMRKDSQKLETMLDWGSAIPHINDSYISGNPLVTHGLIILGNTPEPNHGLILHPIIQHYKGLIWSWCYFTPSSINVLHYTDLLSYFVDDPVEWATDSIHIKSPKCIKSVTSAYKAARQARFEHGESP